MYDQKKTNLVIAMSWNVQPIVAKWCHKHWSSLGHIIAITLTNIDSSSMRFSSIHPRSISPILIEISISNLSLKNIYSNYSHPFWGLMKRNHTSPRITVITRACMLIQIIVFIYNLCWTHFNQYVNQRPTNDKQESYFFHKTYCRITYMLHFQQTP